MAETLRNWPQKLLLASPRGFCAGVVRAVDALNQTIEASPGETVYSYHEIIHNNHVAEGFRQRGVVFVNTIDEVPEGSVLLFSAHGVSPQIRDLAQQRRMRVIDATCPLVAKTHTEAMRFLADDKTVLYIGHANHDETIGTLGHAPRIRLIETEEDVEKIEVENPDRLALINQTTLSMDDTARIREAVFRRFPNVVQPPTSDICFATQNRQTGIKEVIREGAEVVVVVGSPSSSNSKRLYEVTLQNNASGFFVDDVSSLKPDDFTSYKVVGLTSGASVPENIFDEVVCWFKAWGSTEVEYVKVANESRIHFVPPRLPPHP